MKSRIVYFPGNSFLHRLHPLVKAAWMVFGTIFVFAVQSAWAVLAVLGLIAVAFLVARVPVSQVRGTRLLVTTALVLGGLQVLFVHQGPVLFQIGPLVVTAGGVEAGIYVAARFLGVVGLSYLFVLTTEPNDLAYALMRVGLPYRYGYALITALRLVPIFEQEGQIVYRAQLLGGEPKADDDVDQVAFFTPDKDSLPPLAFHATRVALKRWRDRTTEEPTGRPTRQPSA